MHNHTNDSTCECGNTDCRCEHSNCEHSNAATPVMPKSVFDQMSSKISFFFGLMIGICLISLVGFITLLVLNNAWNPEEKGQNDALAAPTTGGDSAQAGTAPSSNIQQAPPPQTQDVSKIQVTKQDHIRGDTNAPVTIVEFSDFQCPFCQSFHPEMKKLIEQNPGKVRWIYKHFPLSFHKYAQKAAEASECASEQGKFWEYSDKLFENQTFFSDTYFSEAASQLGLNKKNFDNCLSSGKYTQKVLADYQMGAAAGVSGTPGSFINDIYISGTKSYEILQQIVDSLLDTEKK